MVLRHPSSPTERAQCVSHLIAHAGRYGVVTELSRKMDVSRQTLYTWKAVGQQALERVFSPVSVELATAVPLERAILTLLVEGHASERGLQRCLVGLGYRDVALGTISAVVGEAERRSLAWFETSASPATRRCLALDEIFGKQRQGAYLNVVDTASWAVWATAGPVAVDRESWTLLLWEAQDHGLRWDRTVSDGGGAIREACATVDPQGQHGRDVWHLLHLCSQVQGRLDRWVLRLETQTATVARQAERVAAGKRPLGRKPMSDVAAHADQTALATRVAEGFRYLSHQLRLLLEVVVLDRRRGLLDGPARQQELAALLALLAELPACTPSAVQRELEQIHTGLTNGLPEALVFTEALDRVQRDMGTALGADNLALVAWAWQRRSILGPSSEDLLPQLPERWRQAARVLMRAWDEAVRASSAAENWHSILRPHLAVHRKLSPGLLALLAVWHNHRAFQRGAHAGKSPLHLSGLTDAPTDWLVALSYPPVDRPHPRQPATTAMSLPMAA